MQVTTLRCSVTSLLAEVCCPHARTNRHSSANEVLGVGCRLRELASSSALKCDVIILIFLQVCDRNTIYPGQVLRVPEYV